MTDRDLFSNFDRMRREVDELFGDVFERTGLARRRGGFSPAVDVLYCGEPPRAIVTAELAGVEARDLELEINGRQLILSGKRSPKSIAGDDVYQQIEIERGPFRRVVELAQDVVAEEARARYEDGMLTVVLPLQPGRAGSRTVPIQAEDNS